MRQNVFADGPGPGWGSLQRSPRSPSSIWGRGIGREMERAREEKERKGGREGKERGSKRRRGN